MPALTTLAARALYAAAVILRDEALQDGLEFRHLWSRVLEEDPQLEVDWERAVEESGQRTSTPLRGYVNWSATNLGKAGWLFRGNRRWQLTGLGKEALYLHPDAVDFYGQAGRRYRAWSGRKANCAEAVEVLAKLPDSGGWVQLSELARTFNVHEDILVGVLHGDRPSGWFLALGPNGEAGPGLPLLPHELDTWRNLLHGEGLLDEAHSSADTVRAVPDSRITVEQVLALTGGDTFDDELPDDERPRQLWIIRGTDPTTGVPLIRGPWRDRSVVSLATDVPPALAGRNTSGVRKAVDTALPATPPARRDTVTRELDAFLNRMREGDIVLSTDGYHTYVGVVRGPVAHSAEQLERPVDWRNLNKPLDFFKDLPSGLSAVVEDSDVAVFEATEYAETVLALIGDMPRTAASVPQGPAILPDVTDELATQLNMPNTSWLQDCVELLRTSPQLIFHGPPGTGKTFIALALARHLAGASSTTNVRLVQFHPAYAYEDFFEGIRPRLSAQDDEKDGSLRYDLHRGPLRRLADEAERRPAEVFVLVVDEINRGHLAKIFGELYFLLEYRTERVHLLYGSDDGRGFRLPPNLYILGTMNTVDRSVAYMDAAMRRRFSFVELHPDAPPVNNVLDAWLRRRAEERSEDPAGYDDSYVRLFREVNRLLAESSPGDRSFRVGPSYFMQELAHAGDGALDRLWRTQMIPLLTEHHWGDGTDVDAVYGLDVLRNRLDISPLANDDTGATDS